MLKRRERRDDIAGAPIQKVAGKRRTPREEVLDAAAKIEADGGVVAGDAVFLVVEAVDTGPAHHVRVPRSAFPVVDKAAVKVDRLERAAEALAREILPRAGDATANRHAAREVPFDVATDLEAVLEAIVGRQRCADG